MESVVLIGVGESTSRELRPTTEACGAVLAHVSTADEALHELKRADHKVAVMVLGQDLREPIQALQRIHSLSSDLSVVVLAAPTRLADLKKAILFAPLIGRHVECLDSSDPRAISETIAQSITTARQRSSYLTLVTDLNQGLASRRKSGSSNPEAWKHAFVDRLLESVPLGIASVNDSGTILSWNREASVIFGKTEAEMLGFAFIDLFTDPEAKKNLRAQIKRAIDEPSFRSTPIVFDRPVAGLAPPQSIEVSIAAIQGKEHAAGAIALFQDVTDRVLAHQRLAEREQLFRSFFSVAGVGIVQTDVASGRLLRANLKMQSMVGYSEPELQRMSFKDLTHPEDRDRDFQGYRDLVGGRIPSYSTEKRYIRKDGQVIWASLNVELVRDQAGAPATMLAAVQDITDQKVSEEMLKEAIRARDEFLSVASHELKTPISSVKLYMQSILRFSKAGKEPILPSTETRLVSALNQVDRLTNLVDDLLEVTRMANGKLHYEFSEMDLSPVVEQTLSGFADAADAAGCEISFAPAGPVVGNWDRFRLEQVVSNLVSNAIRYGRGKPIVVSLRLEEASAILSVKDEGIGIPPESQERIFDRFEQMNTSRKVGGLGLGLYIVKQIVTAHRGTVKVDSRPGEGSVFSVRLPLQAARDLKPSDWDQSGQ